MKSHHESSKTSQVGIGKVRKVKSHKKTLEKAKITEYLIKLQEIVPILPKDKRLSKLEVISNVIDYIHDLRETLGLPVCSDIFDTEVTSCEPTAKSNKRGFTSPVSKIVTTLPTPLKHHKRKPFCVIPNTAR